MECKTCQHTNKFSFVLRNNDFSRCFPLEGGSVATLMVHEGVLLESCPGTAGVLVESCLSPVDRIYISLTSLMGRTAVFSVRS